MNLVAAVRARRSLVLLVTLGVLIYGVASLFALPSGIYPEVEFARVVVVARLGDLQPELLETVATRPLEEAVATAPYLRRLRSRTIRGATQLDVQFAPGIDTWRALQLVESKVAETRSELPAEVEIEVERVTAAAVPVLTFNVEGHDDPRVLREVATRILRPALTRVPGVGQVTVQGGDEREIEVVLRPEALAAAHLTPSAVADRLAESDFVNAVGRAHEAHQVLTVVAASEHTTPEAIAALPIATGPNGPVLLASLAEVFVGAVDRTMAVGSPHGDAVVVMIDRAPQASVPDVVAAAKRVVAQLRRSGALPRGIRLDVVYDESKLIEDAMRGVRDAIVIGMLLALVVLAFFLRDLRAGAAAALAVPITLIATFGLMRLTGQTLNLMSLGGLAVAIGLIVDDAIVIVEAIVSHRERGLPVTEAAERGVHELFGPVVGTTLTTVIVFAPLPLIAGVVGSFFSALAVTLSAAVLLSLVASVTLVPLAALRLLRDRTARPAAQGLQSVYARLLRRAIPHRAASLAVIAAFTAAGVLAALHVPVGFLPSMDEGAFVLDFFLPPGTSLEETNRVARGLDHALSATPGVVNFTRRTGAEMGPATATQQNTGDVMVRLAPRSERRSVFAIMDDVRERVAREVPGADVELIQVLQDVLDDLSGNPHPIEVRIFGADPRELDRLALEAAQRIEEVPGLEDLWNGVEGDVPALRVELDPRAVERLGATPAQVAADLAVVLGGRVAASVRVENYTIGVRVRMSDAVRFDPGAIADLSLAVGSSIVPLSAVATVSRATGSSVIHHENLSRVVLVTAAIADGADLGAVVAGARARLRSLALPAGYRLEVGGQIENAAETQRDLMMVLGLGSLLVLTILLVQLRSLRLSLVVLAGAPLSMLGAALALLVTHTPLNASSLMGCVLLAGLVVKNGILLFERALAERATAPSFAEAVVRAGERRVRPILMTTAATLAGLLPFALGLGAGTELQRPLAIATIGGLLFSTLISLLVMPALAVAVEPRASV